jgi:hypothetical protein
MNDVAEDSWVFVRCLLTSLNDQGTSFASTSPEGPRIQATYTRRAAPGTCDTTTPRAKTIRPKFTKEKLTWKEVYAGRRGAATAVVGLTNPIVPAQELLRHKSLTTTAMFYKKVTSESLQNGLKMLEAARTKK